MTQPNKHASLTELLLRTSRLLLSSPMGERLGGLDFTQPQIRDISTSGAYAKVSGNAQQAGLIKNIVLKNAKNDILGEVLLWIGGDNSEFEIVNYANGWGEFEPDAITIDISGAEYQPNGNNV